MILLLGGTGYIGTSFIKEFKKRNISYYSLSRNELDYTNLELLIDFLKKLKPDFLINSAGYTGKPNVDSCEIFKNDTLNGNVTLPFIIAIACNMLNIPWGHVSSGCIYSGSVNSSQKQTMDLFKINPKNIIGFSESDTSNFSFKFPPCSFYSGTKSMAEELLVRFGNNYVWRLRVPFDEFDSSRNYLSKLQRYSKVYSAVNSLSHRGDFVSACLDLWEIKAPFGIYNVTNPGIVNTEQILKIIKQKLKLEKEFQFWESDEEFYNKATITPRSNCVLDTSKLLSTGVKLRNVFDALNESLDNWKPSSES